MFQFQPPIFEDKNIYIKRKFKTMHPLLNIAKMS